MKLSKSLITWLCVLGAVLCLVFWCFGAYNGLVKADEEAAKAWSEVENVYQRRADLIPNLVATVKGYAAHEQETLEAVMSARAKATQVTVDPSRLDGQQLQAFQQAQGELSTALGRLLMITENYPNLKANESFLNLQAQLEGSENRIAVARKKFNEAVQAYNVKTRRFPHAAIAGLCGFEKKAYFEAQPGSETVPQVAF
jgi:LemA protein